MLNIEGHLFVQKYFLDVANQFLPVIQYYVVRNNIVHHINVDSMQESPSGDSFETLLAHCKDLGEYSARKVKKLDSKYIDKDVLFKYLVKEGYVFEKHNKAMEKTTKNAVKI